VGEVIIILCRIAQGKNWTGEGVDGKVDMYDHACTKKQTTHPNRFSPKDDK